MRRVTTTVVALVGREAAARVSDADAWANVVAIRAPAGNALARAQTAWHDAASVHAPYAVHDADPLADVADAWVRLYEASGARGELEVHVAALLERWRAGALDLPDFYLVLDPDSLGPTARHWYFGVLAAQAPHRVIAAPATEGGVRDALAHLGAGRWWPPLDELLDGIDRVVPDGLVPTRAVRI